MYSVKNTRYPSSYTSENRYKDSKNVKEKENNTTLTEEKEGADDKEAGAETEVAAASEKNRNKGFPEEEAAVLYLGSIGRKKEEEEKDTGKVSELLSQAEAIKESIERTRENQTNLYDATMDLMAIESTEQEARLKAIQVRLMFKMRTIKASGAKSSEIQAATNKIKKVLGKLKTKIKKLKEEAGIEKKRQNAARAKQRRMEEKLRRELEVKRAIRKKRERKDVEESRMGMGANYGGPTGSDPVSMQDFGLSGITTDSSLMDLMMGESTMGIEAAAAVGAIAGGAVAGDVGAGVGGIDISI